MFWLIVAFYSGCNSCTTGKKVANFDFFGQLLSKNVKRCPKKSKLATFLTVLNELQPLYGNYLNYSLEFQSKAKNRKVYNLFLEYTHLYPFQKKYLCPCVV